MTNNAKKESAAPVIAAEELEIMPVEAAKAVDYEQTAVKPPRIQQIEQYIQKRKDELELLEGRLARIEKQRPDLAFRNDVGALSKLESTVIGINEKMKDIQDQVLGADNELKREIKKWVKFAKEKRQKEANEAQREADELKAATLKHFDAIEQLTGQKAIFGGAMMQQSVKELRMRERIEFIERNVSKVQNEIEKIMK